MDERDMQIIEWLFQQSPLTNIGVWAYGIVCFAMGFGFAILVRKQLRFLWDSLKLKLRKKINRHQGGGDLWTINTGRKK